MSLSPKGTIEVRRKASLIFLKQGVKQMAKQKQENTQEKNKFEEKQPALSRSITLSKDRKWLIVRTIRTDIIHVNYIDKVLSNGGSNDR